MLFTSVAFENPCIQRHREHGIILANVLVGWQFGVQESSARLSASKKNSRVSFLALPLNML